MTGRVTIAIPDTPPSLNTWLSRHWRVRERDKAQWQQAINLRLHQADLPRCSRVNASITFRFPDARKRDHDNFVGTLSKCLGDALRPDFLDDDDSTRFQVIHGQISPEKGPKETIVVIDYEASGEEAA